MEGEISKIIALILGLSVSPCRTEEALRLLLDRREAELREAMKLRHALTTLLHMLRNNMAQVREATADSLERRNRRCTAEFADLHCVLNVCILLWKRQIQTSECRKDMLHH